MAATAFPLFDLRFFTDGSTTALTVGATPAAFYKVEQYLNNTTTNQATYMDIAGTIPNVFPLTLDSTGRCTMYGTPGNVYTFVLKTPSGAVVRTWNDVSPIPVVSGTAYLPLAGGTMTGLITLSGDPTSSLNPATKQYTDAAIAAASAAVAAAVATAVAAAAAATAAVAAQTPTSFRVYSATGGAVSRTVTLTAGTWAVVGETRAHVADGSVTGSYDATSTQAFTVGTTTVNTSVHLSHIGSSGFGRDQHGTNMATGTLTVASAGSYTMAIAAASLGLMTGSGSILTVEKQ